MGGNVPVMLNLPLKGMSQQDLDLSLNKLTETLKFVELFSLWIFIKLLSKKQIAMFQVTNDSAGVRRLLCSGGGCSPINRAILTRPFLYFDGKNKLGSDHSSTLISDWQIVSDATPAGSLIISSYLQARKTSFL